MHLNIPIEFEPLNQAKAAAAGFDDVEAYVIQRLIAEDSDPQIEEHLRQNEQQIDRLVDKAYASGPATPIASHDFRNARDRLASHHTDLR